jgi:hypothetical protein
MGVTIHYRGKLSDTNEIGAFIEELTDIAETMKWPHSVLDEDWSKPATAELTFNERGAEIIGDLSLKGISFIPHPKCEGVSLFFDADGNLRDPMSIMMILDGTLKPEDTWLSVKTQYAPLNVHITIVKLLKYLKNRYISNLEVNDEGQYWETSDPHILKVKMEFLNEKLEQVAHVLESADMGDTSSYTPEQMLSIIEELLSKKLGLEKID